MTVPAIGAAAVPPEVRKAGPEATERYESARSFEQLLLGRLTRTMLDGTPLAQGPYADTVADAFAEGVSAAGGLGLTETLYRSMTLRTPT
jgi:hypothetical protein